jgi:lipopolysaccharide export LptBFGC system permease protein LptF
MTDLTALLVGGIPLLVVIFGLVEFSKSLGLKGNGLIVFSLFLGVVFGISYKIAESGMPSSFAGWFLMIVFGLALGLITSGFYDFADKRLPKTGP